MRITVKFLGPVKEIIGEPEREFDLNKGTVGELLDNIMKLYPKTKEKLKPAGVFIKGRIVKKSELQVPLLKEGDEVSLVLPVAGG
nr:MoaD/ThiS family protein [Candidatus Njordarchaeota archaeon]